MGSAARKNETVTRLRLRITARAESIVRSGHPWLFAESIIDQNRAGRPGDLAVIYDRRDRFLAFGLFDPDSPLRVRLLHVGEPQPVDRGWWAGRLQQALSRRHGLFDNHTTGLRWINGENDGWPGLVLDAYDRTLVLKLYTLAWLPWLELGLDLIREQLQPDRIVLRLSRNIQSAVREQFGRTDGQVLWGQPLVGPVIFLETGLRFEADVLRGQKTGFFLDQRENRRQVEQLARGKRVLNAFSFTGGFSLYAARGGAWSVTDVDISPHALAASRRNFALNQQVPTVARCRHETVQADVFDWLAQLNEIPGDAAARLNRKSPRSEKHAPFDLVILDPPSLAKREAERAGALKAYTRLVALGLARLGDQGILVACSCSAHVSAAEFFGAVREAAGRSGRQFNVLQTTLHAADHPASFPEGHYLKAIYLEVKTSSPGQCREH